MPVAVTRHLEMFLTFAPLHRPQADLHFCTADGSESRPYLELFASSLPSAAVLSAHIC